MRHRLSAAIILALLAMAFIPACTADTVPTAAPDEPTRPQPPADDEPDPTTPPTLTPQAEAGETPAPPTAVPTEVALSAGAEPLVARAREDLAQKLDLPTDAIRLVSVEAVEWPDAGLGCPQPGLTYAQLVTPGFLVLLEAQDQTYTYHTDTDRRVVLCGEEGRPVYPVVPVAPGEKMES